MVVLGVQPVVADDAVFPAHRIMHRMSARIAPIAIEIEFGEGGARSTELDELASGEEGRIGCGDLRFGDGDGCGGDGVGGWVGGSLIDKVPGALEQGIGGIDRELHLADFGDDMRILIPCSTPLSFHGRVYCRTKRIVSWSAPRAMP